MPAGTLATQTAKLNKDVRAIFRRLHESYSTPRNSVACLKEAVDNKDIFQRNLQLQGLLFDNGIYKQYIMI